MRLVFKWLLLFVATFNTRTMASPTRLTPINPLLRNRNPNSRVSASVSSYLKPFFYDQTLDHFNYIPESYVTFPQRYLINSKWWGGANTNAPIFAYLGAEGPIKDDIEVIGFLTEHAPRFKALQVYLEHRFYGESNPVGSMEKSLKNKTLRGYLNSAQALADYAEVLLHIKKKLHAHHSPIIVIGGSYGGMLASWFRLKYPHIALGALASSAPILYFDDITSQDGYYSIVSKDFREVSENCYTTIKKSWKEIDKVASLPNGLAILAKKFRLCTTLNDSLELKDSIDSIYTAAAQYNEPPMYTPMNDICEGIDGASNDADILDRVFAGLVTYIPNTTCYHMEDDVDRYSDGWYWQICSELVMRIHVTTNDSMFPLYDPKENYNDCNKWYHDIMPRTHWVTTYYGGHDIKMVLKKFGSNIIFSNGLKDPYSIGGVLEDISDTILAVKTSKGSHCLDLYTSEITDPEWLVTQRDNEVKIIRGWLRKYYQDLNKFDI